MSSWCAEDRDSVKEGGGGGGLAEDEGALVLKALVVADITDRESAGEVGLEVSKEGGSARKQKHVRSAFR